MEWIHSWLASELSDGSSKTVKETIRDRSIKRIYDERQWQQRELDKP